MVIPCLYLFRFSSCTAHYKKIPRLNGLGMWWTVQDSNL